MLTLCSLTRTLSWEENLPTDAFYKAVPIRESRRNLAVENESDSEYDDIVESEYQMIEKYPLYHHCHGHRHGHHHHHHQHHHQHEITPLHHPSSLFCIIFELKTALADSSITQGWVLANRYSVTQLLKGTIGSI